MKTLVLAEKPSVGKDIARVLSCRKGNNGYLEGDKYIVTWALGHLVTLADPEKYNENYKTWKLEDLPIIPEKLELIVIKETSKQYGIVKELLNRKDVTEIVIATDAGREGELVARWILEKANCKKPLKRLWISSVTDKAIKEGFSKLKDGKQYINLCNSAKARAEADWIVGINATRCLTTKYNSQLSCGRVQTPTIAIIARREEEIRNFKPQKYYGATAIADKFNLLWQDSKTNDIKTFDQNKITAIIKASASLKEGIVTDITKTAKKTYPPKLYDLTELQRDANKRFGFSPKETLSIMQKLYEFHKVLTYPRTDSRYISADIVSTIPDRLKGCAARPYAKICSNLLRTKITANPNFVDDKKVSDHHAIIPTEQAVDLNDLNEKERKVYDLVVTRFLSVLYPPFEYEQTGLKVKIGSETFIANGKIVLKQGFKEVNAREDRDDDDSDEIKEQTLPILKKGDKIQIENVRITEGRTKPPSLFNEATLLTAMENPAKYMDSADQGNNKELAKTLGETGGLGTVATRADIIEKLFDSFMIEKKDKDIYSTSKGRQLLLLVPKELKSPRLTAQWEQNLSLIANGNLNKDVFLKDIRTYTKAITQEIKQSTQTYRHDNLTNTKCPDCGKFMLEVNGKKGKMYVCQDRECGHRKNVSFITNSRCPNCHKKLEIVGEGDGRRVVCVCGHKEKYDTFVKRKEEENNKPNKKDLQKYISQINSKEEKNNPLAAALKDFKF